MNQWLKKYGKDRRPLADHPNVPRKLDGSVDVVQLLSQQAWMRDHSCSWLTFSKEFSKNPNVSSQATIADVLGWLDDQAEKESFS